ncbi:MAG: GDSL-type esterase/lipase family protein [Longimicrobiaceae bacterium]
MSGRLVRRRAFGNAELALLLLGVLAINPVVVYMLVPRAWIAVGLTLATAAALQLCYRRFGKRLPTVYLVNLICVLGLFVHAEVLVRYRFSDYVMDDLYWIRDGYYVNRSGLRSRLTDKEYSVNYLTNRDGFRIGYSQQVDVSYDRIDWLFLGDSYTQGAQVNFEDLYTTRVYRRFPDRIVANVGISGWGVPEEVNYFRQVGRRYGPRIVFLQVSIFNDFMKVRERSAGVSDHLMQHSQFVRLLLQDFKFENPVRLPLGRWAEPFYADSAANRRYNVFYTLTGPEKEQDLFAYREYLARFVASVRQSGARPVIILLPTKEQIRPAYLDEVVREFGIDRRDLDMRRPNVLMHHLADSLRVDLIDVLDEFTRAPGEPYFAYDEHLSPYGHQLLADIIAEWVARAGTPTPPRILSADYAGDRYPSYLGDGRSVLFQSFADGNMELFWSDSTFSGANRITFNDVDESHPTLGYPGDRLAFTQGDAAAGNTKVVLSDLSARVRRLVTDRLNEFGAIPSFSPDGQSLAYAGWSGDPRTRRYTTPRIIICDLATGAKREITNGRSEAWRPVFSPDGRSIVYISKVGTQFDLFLQDLASGAVRRLTNTPFDEWDPQFSPDASQVVYAARGSGNWDLFVLSVATRQRRQLTATRGNEWDPAFSPDGESVVYGGEYGIFRGIYRMALPGVEGGRPSSSTRSGS